MNSNINYRIRDKFKRGLIIFLLIAVIIFFVFPLFWSFLTSIKVNVDAWSMPPKFIFKPTLENYRIVLFEKNFLGFIINSIVVGLFSTAMSIILGTPLAYSLARSKFKINNLLFIFVLIAYILPPIVLSIPLYIFGSKIGGMDKYYIIIITHMTFGIAFTVWMMRGFFEEVPLEVEESALVDGCNYFSSFFRITLPMVKPGLAATVIFCFILSWNDFMYALVLTSMKVRTVPVAIAQFLTPHGMYWGQMNAAGILAILPILLFAMFFQRYIVRGMALGAIK